MLKALRHRPFQAVVIALLAALVVGCAGIAPLYVRAMLQAQVDLSLAHARPVDVGMTLTSHGSIGGTPSTTGSALSPDLLTSAVPGDLATGFRGPVGTASVAVVSGHAGRPLVGRLLWRDHACAHLRLLSGHCPRAADEILVSRADRAALGLGVGTGLDATEDVENPTEPPRPVRLRVVGVYVRPAGAFWADLPTTARSGTRLEGGEIQHDDWIADQDGLFAGTWVSATSQVFFGLDQDTTGVDQILRLGTKVAAFRDGPGHTFVDVRTGLTDISDTVRTGQEQARVIVPLLMAQLALLGLVVLWMVLGAAADQRRPEVALTRLRGGGTRGAWAFLLRDLLPVALLGVPIGIGLAFGVSSVARVALLPGDAPFEVASGFGLAVLAATAALVATTLAASRRVSREPVVALLRQVPPRRAGLALGVADAMLVAVAGTAVVALASGGLTGPVAVVAPSLLALGVGVVLAHLAGPVTTGAGRGLLARGRVAPALGLMQAARRPATRRLVVVLSVAAALLVFAVDAVAIGGRNRDFAAQQELGAPMVATVQGTDVRAVRAALAEVDPRGREVTPVVVLRATQSGSMTTMAVVPDQFARIALFPDQVGTASALSRLRAPDVQPIRLSGHAVTLRLSTQGMFSSNGDPGRLMMDLLGPDGQLAKYVVGRIAVGSTRPLSVRVPVRCSPGCVLIGFAISGSPGNTTQGGLTVSRFATDDGRTHPLGPASHWQPEQTPDRGTMTPSETGDDGALVLRVDSEGSSDLLLRHRWVVSPVPALTAGPLPDGASPHGFTNVGLDAQDDDVRRVGTLVRAPAGTPSTEIANLDVIARAGGGVDSNASVQVWFGDQSPARLTAVTRALARHGGSVQSVERLTETRRSFDESTAAWSLWLGALVGLAALLVGALVMLVVAVTSWRLRARDLASLRMTGLSPRALSRAAVGEQLPAVVVAVLAGAVCGVLGAHFALPTIPLLPIVPEVSTLDVSTAWVAVLLAVLATLLALGATGWLTGRAVARRATLDRVRETQ